MTRCEWAGCTSEATTTVPAIPPLIPVPFNHPGHASNIGRHPACAAHADQMRKEGKLRRLSPLVTDKNKAEQALARVMNAPDGQAEESDLQFLAGYATQWDELARIEAEQPQQYWDALTAQLDNFISQINKALLRGV